ncbi:MAG: hydroxypyruvate isomerase family protein [Betaproteobacteria bacterium]|nr:hydroxypyruvate isomerase family protein [Betaproteobacteria bacterium]
MPRFAANLSMMYTEVPFLDRFAACARDGFRAVEFLFPYEHPAAEIAARLRDNGLQQVLFNAPPGDFGAGERGIASLPGREDEFRRGIDTAIAYAAALGCPRLHVMAGLVRDPAQRQAQWAIYAERLAWAAQRLAQAGLDTLIEPINTRDIPGYLLNTQAQAHDLRAQIGQPRLKVQMDLYHCQIVEGDVAMKIRRHIDGVGHVQIAGVPQRHEPDLGELHHPYLFAVLDEVGYTGWIGCEYRPRAGTSAGLGWIRPWLPLVSE